MLAEAVNLEQFSPRLSELVDQARDNDPVVLARGGQAVAVIMDFEEYRRLKETEREQAFAILLADNPDGLPEEEAIALAVEVTREVRAERYAERMKK